MSSSSPESWTRRHSLDVTRKQLVKSGFLPSSPSKNTKNSKMNKTVTASSQPVSPENTVSSQTILSSSTSNNNASNSTFKRKNTNASSSAGLNRTSTSMSGFSRMTSSSPKASTSSSSMLAAGGNASGSDAANAESEMLFPIRLNWMGVQKSESSVVFKARDPEAEAEFSKSQRASMLVRVRNLLDKNKLTSDGGQDGNSSHQTGAFSREALEKGFVSYLDGSYGHSRNALNKYNAFVREKMAAVLEEKKTEYLRLKNGEKNNNENNNVTSEDQKDHALSPEQIALIEAADGDENYFNASCNFPSNEEFGPLPPLEEGKGLIPSNSLSAANWREFKGHEGTVGYNFRAATSSKEISDKYPFFKNMKLGEDFISPSNMGTPRESMVSREEGEEQDEQQRQEAEAERQRRLQQEKEEEEQRQRKLKQQQEAAEEEEKRQRELREQEEMQKQRSLNTKEMNEAQLGATENSLQKSSSEVCKSPPRLPPRKASIKSSEEEDTAAAAAASQQKQQSPKPKEKEKGGCCCC